jgi:cytochrome bd ubiquinol oxidase subunit II
MTLAETWFVLIAVLWGGYFLLEGFDFGVGMLLPFLPRDEQERSIMFRSIGPVWDGNEVWLVAAGGATFAAFPAWYATMFSGYYLALLLVLVFLIVRVVSFEWRTKTHDRRWRAVWTWVNTTGSFGASFVWGVALTALLYGVPINSSGDFSGDLADLFNPYTVLGGITVVVLFAYHGATFLTLKTAGELCRRAQISARRLSLVAVVVGAAFLGWTVAVAVDRNEKSVVAPLLLALVAIAALVLSALALVRRRTGLAFAFTGLAVLLWIATVFVSLYPRVIVSSTDFANSLTVSGTASAHYTLVVITVAAAIFIPAVIAYQGWSYHVFRGRLGGDEPAAGAAAAAPAESEAAAYPPPATTAT